MELKLEAPVGTADTDALADDECENVQKLDVSEVIIDFLV